MILEKHNGAFRVLAGQHFLEGNAVGTIVSYAGTSLPTGYLPCDGAAVSRIVYSELFSCIGTTYGAGDGSTTFNVPNLNDKYLKGSGTKAVGASQAAGLPMPTIASGGGHSHTLTTYYDNLTGTIPNNINAFARGTEETKQTKTVDSAGAHTHAITADDIYKSTNTTVDVDAVIVKFCIKYTKTVGAVAQADNESIHVNYNGTLGVIYQAILDTCHPINSVWVQYTANDNPNTLFNIEGKYSSTWEDISSSFEGRYFKVDNTNTVGTQIEAGLPNIKGTTNASIYSPGSGGTQYVPTATGALSDTVTGKQAATGLNTYGGGCLKGIDFNAHNSNAIYDDANTTVTPLTSTIKVWKRTL